MNAVTAAAQIDQDVHALIIGNNSEEAQKALAALPLVKKVISVEAAHYENFTAENFAPVSYKIIRKLFSYSFFCEYFWKKFNAKNCSNIRYIAN